MGMSFSCPFSAYNDIENGFESVIVKSINFGNDEAKTPLQSTSFNGRDSKPTIMQSIGSQKMMIEKSVSFKTVDNEIISSIRPSSTEENNKFVTSMSTQSKEIDNCSSRSEEKCALVTSTRLPFFDSSSPKHEAAIKLQKVYKSFRTRRKLADCAVLIEQSWWKLLDFAELKRSSISFFGIEKHESAISRWSRARTRAAKVGKGLSQNGKAQKLALQHWLEAIDPRHRYGHNLHFYYVKWLHSQSKEPFFYWLDVGEGKEANLVEKCPRSKLQQQCIKYLGPMERKAYEVVVEDGKLLYKETCKLLDTTREPNGTKWIFVLSTAGTLYVGKKKKGTFQHSSFLAGGATLAAGRIVVEEGILKAVWPHSGHYRPTPENFQDFVLFLRENNVDITDVKMVSVDDEEESVDNQSSNHLRSNSSEGDIDMEEELSLMTNSIEEEDTASMANPPNSPRKLTNLHIPKRDDFDETPEESFDEEQEVIITEESILQRINSHKGTGSYQLGKQLSCKWSTGAGPRIGCLRDYPLGLQSRALEQVNLSPKSDRGHGSNSSWVSIPTSFSTVEMEVDDGSFPRRSTRNCGAQSSPLCKGTSANAIFTPS
ncbi:hypothetical protein LguiA_021928 [Lonicera macranthoides]